MSDIRAEFRRVLADYARRHVGPVWSYGRLTDRERERLKAFERRHSFTPAEHDEYVQLTRAMGQGDPARDCFLALASIQTDAARNARKLLAQAFDAPAFDPRLFMAGIRAVLAAPDLRPEFA